MKEGVWQRQSKEFGGDEARNLAEMKKGAQRRRSKEFGRDEARSSAETKCGVWQSLVVFPKKNTFQIIFVLGT